MQKKVKLGDSKQSFLEIYSNHVVKVNLFDFFY